MFDILVPGITGWCFRWAMFGRGLRCRRGAGPGFPKPGYQAALSKPMGELEMFLGSLLGPGGKV